MEWPGHAALGFLHLRQRRGAAHLRVDEQRLRRLLGLRLLVSAITTARPRRPAGSFVSVTAGTVPHLRGEERRLRRLLGRKLGLGQATPPSGSFISVTAGGSHTCGVRRRRLRRLLGLAILTGQATPPAGSFASVSAGDRHTCGVTSDGSVACWGDDYWFSDYYGQATPPAGSFVSVSAETDTHLRGAERRLRRLLGRYDWDGQIATPPFTG